MREWPCHCRLLPFDLDAGGITDRYAEDDGYEDEH